MSICRCSDFLGLRWLLEYVYVVMCIHVFVDVTLTLACNVLVIRVGVEGWVWDMNPGFVSGEAARVEEV